MSLSADVQEFLQQFDNNFLPTDPQAVRQASEKADELLERYSSRASSSSGVPPEMVSLSRVAGTLKFLVKTHAQQDESLKRKREALGEALSSERIRLQSLELSIADLRKKLAASKDSHARARLQACLSLAIEEYQTIKGIQ
jgi:hypothetical protein